MAGLLLMIYVGTWRKRVLLWWTLNDSMNIIDVETTEAVYHTDSELKEFLSNTHGVSNPLMVQSLEKSRRNYILKSMKDYGAGIRQLSRLTGVSYGVIQKL